MKGTAAEKVIGNEYSIATHSFNLTGLLEVEKNNIFDYTLQSRVSEEFLNSKSSASSLASIVRALDDSRSEDYQHRYGTTLWTGTVDTDNRELCIAAEYSVSSSREDLPERYRFQRDLKYGEDPYDILEEPLQFKIEGEPDLAPRTVKETL